MSETWVASRAILEPYGRFKISPLPCTSGEVEKLEFTAVLTIDGKNRDRGSQLRIGPRLLRPCRPRSRRRTAHRRHARALHAQRHHVSPAPLRARQQAPANRLGLGLGRHEPFQKRASHKARPRRHPHLPFIASRASRPPRHRLLRCEQGRPGRGQEPRPAHRRSPSRRQEQSPRTRPRLGQRPAVRLSRYRAAACHRPTPHRLGRSHRRPFEHLALHGIRR